MTPLKRQKREEITSPQPPKQALATPTRPTPEKKAKTKAANDQQLRSSPKVLLRPSKLGVIGTETPSETIEDKSEAENSPFSRGEGK